MLYAQDGNDEVWAVCRSDMLIKGEDADNSINGDLDHIRAVTAIHDATATLSVRGNDDKTVESCFAVRCRPMCPMPGLSTTKPRSATKFR